MKCPKLPTSSTQQGKACERPGREGLIGVEHESIVESNGPRGNAVVDDANTRVQRDRIAADIIAVVHSAAASVEEGGRIEGGARRKSVRVVRVLAAVREFEIVPTHRRDIVGPVCRIGPGVVETRRAAPGTHGGPSGL